MSTLFATTQTLEPPNLQLVGYESDPSMFITDQQHAQSSKHPVTFEAVIDSPVDYAPSLWTAHYAQQLANANSPVGILHLESDAVRMDVVQAARQSRQTRADERSWSRLLHERSARDLWRRWTLDAPASVRHWIIRVTQPRHAKNHAMLQAIPQWTLLIQSHNNAIASAYTLTKSLMNQKLTSPNHRIAALSVGSPRQAGEQAQQRLARLLFPNAPERLECLGNLRQIKPVHVRFMHRVMLRPGDLRTLARLIQRQHNNAQASLSFSLEKHRKPRGHRPVSATA